MRLLGSSSAEGVGSSRSARPGTVRWLAKAGSAARYGAGMPSQDAERLWRPVGLAELRLIEKADHRAFPPRLPEQPIFYPVLNFEYAEQIARDWNSKDAGHDFLGFVTEFDVHSDVVAGYETHQVGARQHRELWVPAEELMAFNAGVVGEIRVVAEYRQGERVS